MGWPRLRSQLEPHNGADEKKEAVLRENRRKRPHRQLFPSLSSWELRQVVKTESDLTTHYFFDRSLMCLVCVSWQGTGKVSLGRRECLFFGSSLRRYRVTGQFSRNTPLVVQTGTLTFFCHLSRPQSIASLTVRSPIQRQFPSHGSYSLLDQAPLIWASLPSSIFLAVFTFYFSMKLCLQLCKVCVQSLLK